MSQDNARIGAGIAYMISGMLIVPIMDAIAKYLGEHMSPLQITWGRFVFQFVIMGVAILLTLDLNALIPRRPLIHALRGVLLVIATTFFFFSLRYLPLADAIAIFFVQPMILTLMSAVFLGEQIGWHRRLAVISGFVGALIIIQPGSETFTIAGLLPLCAALFFASYLALTRSVANIDHPLTMQFASGIAATVTATVALAGAGALGLTAFIPIIPTTGQWMWLALIGVIAAVGHLLVVVALNRAPASLLAPFSYMEIVSAVTLGWIFFNDWPSMITWLGITIIVASGLYVFFREHQHKQRVDVNADSGP